MTTQTSLDPDAQCPTHGCARWRCDPDHPPTWRYEIKTGPAHHSGERPWMRLASTTTVEAKTVGSRCVYLAVTTDQDAIEAALEADDDVTTYNVVR